MAFINMKHREVQAKIVYYGPGRGGKTTNLEYIYQQFRDRIPSEMVSIKTHGDRTLFFDFMPLDVGKIRGYDVRIQLYTVPGQAKYDATRRLVLKGVDGIVFVADSLAVQRERNIESFQNMLDHLAGHKKAIQDIALVMQYNKRDLENQGIPMLSIEQLDADLNPRKNIPTFPASALKGINVVVTLKKIIAMTMTNLNRSLT